MRSGNGRHRRPRQVPALVVTAGVTGSALALPLLAATNATAADASTWDRVAECESGGSWSANFGSGVYGGLQFTQDQWRGAGGLDFAERPDLASRSQQIAVAERVLASQGPQAWPLCAASAGLVQQGPAAEVDPGLPGAAGSASPTPNRPDAAVPVHGSGAAKDFGAPTPTPSDTPAFAIPDAPSAPPGGLPVMPAPDDPTTAPADPAAPVTPGGPGATPADPTAPVAPTTPVDPTAPTGPADPTAPAGPGAPTTPAPGASTGPTPQTTPGASTDPSVPPALPAEGKGKHRGTPAFEAPGASDAASDPSYTVKSGDSLTAIADANGLKGGWNALYAANEQVIGGDANLITPGQNLDLTAK
ncbi:transglycosylase family protein [Streptomyces sp. NPDC058622]|uniref:LysM peptidoglycan-binding domain-containing protein n=1 Tax=Streptomyces sp. NPDC058622 TaxID=3346562 RepID=UPI00364EFD5F